MDQDLPQHAETNDDKESNSFVNCPLCEHSCLPTKLREHLIEAHIEELKLKEINMISEEAINCNWGTNTRNEAAAVITSAGVLPVEELKTSNNVIPLAASRFSIVATEGNIKSNVVEKTTPTTNTVDFGICNEIVGNSHSVHAVDDSIHKNLQMQAIRGVLHKPSCGLEASGPFEHPQPQIKQTEVELLDGKQKNVGLIIHIPHPSTTPTETKPTKDSLNGSMIHFPEPSTKPTQTKPTKDSMYEASQPFEPESQIKQTESHIQIRHWGESSESDEGDGIESESNSDFESNNTKSEPQIQLRYAGRTQIQQKIKAKGVQYNQIVNKTEPEEPHIPIQHWGEPDSYEEDSSDSEIEDAESEPQIKQTKTQGSQIQQLIEAQEQQLNQKQAQTPDQTNKQTNQKQNWDKSGAEFSPGTEEALVSKWQRKMGRRYNILVAKKSMFNNDWLGAKFETTLESHSGHHFVSMMGEQCVYKLLEIVGGPEIASFNKYELKEILDQIPEDARFVCARLNDISQEVESALISKWTRKMGPSYDIIVAQILLGEHATSQNGDHLISMTGYSSQRIYKLLQIVGGPEILGVSKSKLEEILGQMPGHTKFVCGCPKATPPDSDSALISKWGSKMGPSYNIIVAQKSRFETNLGFVEVGGTTQNGHYFVSMKYDYGEQHKYELLEIVGLNELSGVSKSELEVILDTMPEDAKFVCGLPKATRYDITTTMEGGFVTSYLKKKMEMFYNKVINIF